MNGTLFYFANMYHKLQRLILLILHELIVIRAGTTKLGCTALAATFMASASAPQPIGSICCGPGCCQCRNTAGSANWSLPTLAPQSDDDLPAAALAMTCCTFLLSLALAGEAACLAKKLVRVPSPRSVRAASS